ncbi:SRPBCC family protein [Pseudonocardia phyllosphaerae]|uniref:SRPBCC family protein n=1 Tax=Pseudonocardia phyllosphaerae TaxID=3390502 RepID=UPI00397E8CF7
MILDNHLDIPADPDAVFALINDVERVASCLPGAILDGQEDDTYLGRVKFKVGPISAAYAGKIRFTEVAADERRLRLSARGADSHGNGDAEADVTLTVAPASAGSTLDLHTDLVVRGKIAQFGKGAITTVSNKLLDQFARNLAAQLQAPPDQNRPGTAEHATAGGAAEAVPTAGARNGGSGGESLDGLAMLLPAGAGRYAAAAGALAVAFFQGWLLGRVRTQDKLIKELRRDR